MIIQSRVVKEASGAMLFGLDSSLWPAWWHDAMATIQREVNLEIATHQDNI